MSFITRPVVFNGVDINTISGLTVLSVDNYKTPKRKLTSFLLASSNTNTVNSGFYTEKFIVVRVSITRATRDLVETSVDSLLSLLDGLEKQLIVQQSGTLRSYEATLSDHNFVVSGGAYVEIDLVFQLSDVFGYDVNYTQLLYATGRTLYNYTDSFTIDGSAEWQAPIIKITFTALTGGSNKSVTALNPDTNQGVTVSANYSAGDILIIDAMNGTVTINGSNVDFSGAFPMWKKGTGYLQVYDNLLTRTKTQFVYYYKRYK